MAWNVTMLVLHLIGAAALAVLFRHADAFQRLVLGLFGAAFLILFYYYGAAVFGQEPAWVWKAIGHSVEHIGVLLHVARIFLYDQERRCLPTSHRLLD